MEVSSTSSTRQRLERRWAATRAAQDATRAMMVDQHTRWRRATARMDMTWASATRARARRRVRWPSNSSWSSRWRSPQLSQAKRRRRHSSVTRRPDTGRSRTRRMRVSWTRRQANPHWSQRDHDRVDATSTTSSKPSSTTISFTRIDRRCRRTCIVSGLNGASWISMSDNTEFSEAPARAGGSSTGGSSHGHAQRRIVAVWVGGPTPPRAPCTALPLRERRRVGRRGAPRRSACATCLPWWCCSPVGRRCPGSCRIGGGQDDPTAESERLPALRPSRPAFEDLPLLLADKISGLGRPGRRCMATSIVVVDDGVRDS